MADGAFKRGGTGLSFHEEFARVYKDMEYTSTELKKVEKALIYYCSEQNGFLLNKKAANHLADFLKQRLYSQEAFEYIKTKAPLSKSWEKQKKWMDLDPRMGIATGAMAEAIRAVRAGYSGFKVGISKNDPAPVHTWGTKKGKVHSEIIGTYTDIYTYAYILEYGSKSNRQKPRPWFGTSFLKWVNDYAPDLYEPLANELNQSLVELTKKWQGDAGPIDGSDVYSVYSGSAPGKVSAMASAAQAFGYDPESGGASGLSVVEPDTAHTEYEPVEEEIDDLYEQVQERDDWWDEPYGVKDYDKNIEKWITDLDEIWDDYREMWTSIANYMKEYR